MRGLLGAAGRLVERTPLPDAVTGFAIDCLVARTRRHLARGISSAEAEFAAAMAGQPIARATDAANAQHYELPPAFFELVLGPQRKYSCCLYAKPDDDLATAEEQALRETARHADLADGQRILELGCGWGSLSLWLAQRYSTARITAVSNARSQREHIERRASALGLANLRIETADMNDYGPGERFDRVVSVEMFEHIANWPALLDRIRDWLTPEGRLFLHVFSHRSTPYAFDEGDSADWIAQHFFTGGIMPSHGLVRYFADRVTVEAEWRWSGAHYRRTALDWLANYDARSAEIEPILRSVYGPDAGLWRQRWRLFFLATAGLFGHRGGREWGVSHYRLRPVEED